MRVMVVVKATKDSESSVMPDTELPAAMGRFNEAWVKRCPNPHAEDCEIEIRPVFEAIEQ